MKGHNIFRVYLLSYLVLTIGGKDIKSINSGENTEQILIGQQVNRTIQAEDGDIYDCVSVNEQPTLKHPLLKDHKIQMEPSSFLIGLDIKLPLVSAVSQAQLSTIDYPKGTVPILCNNKVDTRMVQRIGMLASDDVQQLSAGIKYWDEVYGTQASINVYDPKVKKDSEDLSASWIQIDKVPKDNEELNESCTDHNCPGFVQVSRSVGLGGRIQPISIYNGPQYVINVPIFKDPRTKNWWLAYGSNNTPIGYWPSSQFSLLKDKGDYAFWGGYVQGPTVSSDPPQMGSEHFSYEGFGKAAFFRNIQVIVDENNKLVTPNIRNAHPGSSDRKLYTNYGYELNDDGMHVYYGGPGKYS
uniref:Neprosin PEP catalytic domain-containing protein n=1 Tax=Oryza punctata TaxID=4537 RepID=A0A0E0K660_ORYPU